jgi:hypothetical protein
MVLFQFLSPCEVPASIPHRETNTLKVWVILEKRPLSAQIHSHENSDFRHLKPGILMSILSSEILGNFGSRSSVKKGGSKEINITKETLKANQLERNRLPYYFVP